jgi:phenylacetaldehyde dehydrogenase
VPLLDAGHAPVYSLGYSDVQASIWTHNLKVAHSLARQIKAGTICVNTHNYGDPAWPFGGFKQSGWGREMGKEVMEHYTETKSVAINLV